MVFAKDDAVNLFSGATASGFSRLIIAPLDVVKIRFQVQDARHDILYRSLPQAFRRILADEGCRAFWKGNLPAELMVIPYGAFQFASFHYFKSKILDFTALENSRLVNLSAGSLSGIIATVFTYPLDLFRTRLAAQHRCNGTFMGTLTSAWADKGISGLYRGLWPTLVGIIPYTAIQFYLYEEMQFLSNHVFHHREHTTVPGPSASLVHFSCGVVAGVGSKFLTMPLDVAKKRFQVDGYEWHPTRTTSVRNYRGVLHCMTEIVRHEGFAALFKGTSASLVKAAPNSAITFLVFEMCRPMFVQLINEK